MGKRLLLSEEKKALRDAYGEALLQLGREREDIVVLDADLSSSTRTAKFAKEFPHRFFNFGVAEQNMVGNAAGLALEGFCVFASSFAIFLSGRAWEIVRNSIAYPELEVKLVATHAGITLGEDGASHQIIEDIALMRSIPHMKVFAPGDYWQTYKLILSLPSIPGPSYVRLSRASFPVVFSSSYTFRFPKPDVLQKGERVALLTTGILLSEVIKLASLIEEKFSFKPWVIHFPTIKPMDKAFLKRLSKKVDLLFSFEEHNIHGGFFSSLSEVLASFEEKPLLFPFGMEDEFGQSGKGSELLDYYSLSAKKLLPKVSRILRKFL